MNGVVKLFDEQVETSILALGPGNPNVQKELFQDLINTAEEVGKIGKNLGIFTKNSVKAWEELFGIGSLSRLDFTSLEFIHKLDNYPNLKAKFLNDLDDTQKARFVEDFKDAGDETLRYLDETGFEIWTALNNISEINLGIRIDDFFYLENFLKNNPNRNLNELANDISNSGGYSAWKMAYENNLFPTYLNNSSKLDATSLDDGFKHINDVELNGVGQVKYNSGNLVGCHNEIKFNLQKLPNGRIKEISRIELTEGVFEIKYNVLKNDGSGDFMTDSGGILKEFTKTVFDPIIYPELIMKELGYKAFKDAIDNSKFDTFGPRRFNGIANGKTIHGYYKVVDGEKVLKTWWIVN